VADHRGVFRQDQRFAAEVCRVLLHHSRRFAAELQPVDACGDQLARFGQGRCDADQVLAPARERFGIGAGQQCR
jgi:hypothetical protein